MAQTSGQLPPPPQLVTTKAQCCAGEKRNLELTRTWPKSTFSITAMGTSSHLWEMALCQGEPGAHQKHTMRCKSLPPRSASSTAPQGSGREPTGEQERLPEGKQGKQRRKPNTEKLCQTHSEKRHKEECKKRNRAKHEIKIVSIAIDLYEHIYASVIEMNLFEAEITKVEKCRNSNVLKQALLTRQEGGRDPGKPLTSPVSDHGSCEAVCLASSVPWGPRRPLGSWGALKRALPAGRGR